MSEPIIDMATYNELCDTAGADFAAELAGTFMEEAPPMLAECRCIARAVMPISKQSRRRRARGWPCP